MANSQYNADSAQGTRPVFVTAASGSMPPDGIAARTVSGLPGQDAVTTFNSIIRS